MRKARTIRWGRAAKILTDIPKCIWQGQNNQRIGNNTCWPNTGEQSAPAVPDQISCQALTHRGWNSAGKQFEEANRESSWLNADMREALKTPQISLSMISLMVAPSWVLYSSISWIGQGPNQKDPTVFNQRKIWEGRALFIGPTRRRVGGKQHKSGSYLVITLVSPISQRHHQTRRPSNSMGSGILGGATVGRAGSYKIAGETNSLQILGKCI